MDATHFFNFHVWGIVAVRRYVAQTYSAHKAGSQTYKTANCKIDNYDNRSITKCVGTANLLAEIVALDTRAP